MVGWYRSRRTLISAAFIIPSKWRMAINRSAEAMTILPFFSAGLFPIIHRPWNA
jgi:molybdopterin-containing oxidoreductase family membrane subunit